MRTMRESRRKLQKQGILKIHCLLQLQPFGEQTMM